MGEGVNQGFHFVSVTFEVPSGQLRSFRDHVTCLASRGRCLRLGVGGRWVNRQLHYNVPRKVINRSTGCYGNTAHRRESLPRTSGHRASEESVEG